MEHTLTEGIRGICPGGWHIPTEGEYQNLIDYSGGESIAGAKLKEIGTEHWYPPNSDATNESGFTAYGAGQRGSEYWGPFQGFGEYARFWTSTMIDPVNASHVWLYYNHSGAQTHFANRNYGFSVRCLKDE